MALRTDPSRYIWLAASLRLDIERLVEHSNTASDLELQQMSTDLTDAAVKIGELYDQLVKLASPAPAAQKGEHLPF